MINTSCTGKSGRLYNRFRYLRHIENQKNKNDQVNRSSSVLPQDKSQQYSMEDMLFLKTVVISPENVIEVRKRLERTRKQRDELVKNVETDLMINFPFFFTHPQLVS